MASLLRVFPALCAVRKQSPTEYLSVSYIHGDHGVLSMKKIRNSIARFCYNNPRFGIVNLMRYVAIGNAVIWLLCMVNPLTANYVVFSPANVLRGQLWRVLSFMLYPPSTGFLGLIAVYFYYWIGSTLEQHWGTAQFNIFYFSGVILTVLYGFIAYAVTGRVFVLDSYYIYLSMFFAFAAMFPDLQVLLFFVIPIKMKWLAIVDAAFFAYEVIVNLLAGDLVAALLPLVAILNFFIFCGDDLLSSMGRSRTTREAVNFRRASRNIRKEQEMRLYRHKCAVCGRTDADYPDLEFRYCSRCAGYHCFCADHINNHIHFTE